MTASARQLFLIPIFLLVTALPAASSQSTATDAPGITAAETIEPDAYYVNRECHKISDDIDSHRGDIAKLLSHAEANALYASYEKVRIACSEYRSHHLSGEAWVVRTDQLREKIEGQDWTPKLKSMLFVNSTIPLRRTYQTYTMILLPSKLTYGGDSLLTLRNEFVKVFSREIGDNNVAIWFGAEGSEELDRRWSIQYCEMMNLDCDKGPFLVTSLRPPDSLAPGDSVVVVSLSGLDVDAMGSVLSRLEGQVLEHRLRQTPLTVAYTVAYFRSRLSAIHMPINFSVRGISVGISGDSTGVVKGLETN